MLSLALLFLLLFCVLFTVHAAVLDGFRGLPLGKTVFGVEVVREDGGDAPGPGRAALRALTFLLVE